jgi:hypothetical protein
MYFDNLIPINIYQKDLSLQLSNISTGVYIVKFSGQDALSITKKWIKL